MTKGAIIQARTGSTRFPAKILKHLPYNSDYTVLDQVIRRIKKSSLIEKIIVATTKSELDKPVIQIAENNNVLHFQGSENDVLARYYFAAKHYEIDTIIRITSDCPCIDWKIIDHVIAKFDERNNYDYVSNTLLRTFPHGLDVEVFSFISLEKSFNETKQNIFREHVTSYIYKSDMFKTYNMRAPPDLTHPNIRITLDTSEDYALLCTIFDFLYGKNEFFCTKDIIELFSKKPWLHLINENVRQKKIFDSLEDELKEAFEVLDLLDLSNAKDLIYNSLEKWRVGRNKME